MQQTTSIRLIRPQVGLLLVTLIACSHDAPRENPLDPELTPPVTLQVFLSDSTGAVTLSWTAYDGEQPLAGYRVERKVQGQEEWVVLATLTEPEQTICVDSTLAAGTAYDYQMVVVTNEGYTSPSNSVSVGGFSVSPVVLLAVDDDPQRGRLRVRWTQYRDPGFLEYRVVRREVGSIHSTTVAIHTDASDTNLADIDALHLVPYSYTVDVVVGISRDTLRGLSKESVLTLPSVQLASPKFDAATASATLQWTPYSGPHFGAYEVRRRTAGQVDVIVERIGEQADTSFADDGLRGGTVYTYEVAVETLRGETVVGNDVQGGIYLPVATQLLDTPSRPGLRLFVGPGDTLVTALTLKEATHVQTVQVSDFGGTVQVDGAAIAVPVLPPALSSLQVASARGYLGERIYLVASRLGVQGNPTGNVSRFWRWDTDSARFGPLWLEWQTVTGPFEPDWVSLALVEDAILMVVEGQTYVVRGDGPVMSDFAFQGRVSELRVAPGERGATAVACLPEQGMVMTGRLAGVAPDWGSYLSRAIGPVVGEGGRLAYPISAAIGPNGHFYILDSGNARIVVLDSARRYVTEWGRRGSAEGEFDFGWGMVNQSRQADYSGSVAVDSQGNVYAADELNRRIQKFAP